MTESNTDMLLLLIAKRYGLRTYLHNSKIIYISFGLYGTMSCRVDTQWNVLNERIKNKLETICLAV